jgi:hypothetical protein
MPLGGDPSPAAARSGGVRNRHPGRTDESLAIAVSRLEDLHDGGGRGALGHLGLDVHHRLVHVGVELVADLTDPHDPLPLEDALELLGDRGERPRLEVARLPREVDVVDAEVIDDDQEAK